jgi:hypothetical protein
MYLFRYTYYYSDGIGIVSVMTDTHITILMVLALYQWWQIHTLLLWCHWHCVSETDTHITILIALALSSLIQYQCHQNSNVCICHDRHNANAIRIVICVSVITDTMGWHCVSDNRCTYYYSDGIAIVSVMTDTHITILMSLTLCQWDRYTYYYSDSISIVSVITDTCITILMALCQW